jgi:hypothetical protein
MADKKNINELIALIERNRIVTGQTWHAKTVDSGDSDEEDEEEEEEGVEEDYSEVRLIIFAAEGPFTESLLPMLDQHEIEYTVTDIPEKVIDIAINNPQIRHVLLDMDRPTNPAKGVNIFMELKMLNPGILVYYCTKNPMTVESRNIQTKGAKLIQKPVLRKTLDLFVAENFKI